MGLYENQHGQGDGLGTASGLPFLWGRRKTLPRREREAPEGVCIVADEQETPRDGEEAIHLNAQGEVVPASPAPAESAERTHEPEGSPTGEPALTDHSAGDGAPLDPGAEEELWTGRMHWKHFLGSLLLGLVVTIGLIVLGVRFRTVEHIGWFAVGAIILVWLVLLVRIAYRVLECGYRLTNQRLFVKRGILTQTDDQTELIRVDDVRVRKTLFDRVVGIGTVEVVSTDASNQRVLIEGVRRPEEIAEHIRRNMRVLRRKSLFIENL